MKLELKILGCNLVGDNDYSTVGWRKQALTVSFKLLDLAEPEAPSWFCKSLVFCFILLYFLLMLVCAVYLSLLTKCVDYYRKVEEVK